MWRELKRGHYEKMINKTTGLVKLDYVVKEIESRKEPKVD